MFDIFKFAQTLSLQIKDLYIALCWLVYVEAFPIIGWNVKTDKKCLDLCKENFVEDEMILKFRRTLVI